MYATIHRYTSAGLPGSTEHCERAAQELTGLLGKLPGFVTCLALEAGDELITLSVFEDRASQDVADQLALAWGTEHLVELGSAPVPLTTGEVIAQRGL